MSNLTVQEKNMLAVESALVMNDISKLSTQERMEYYDAICESVGLNPLTRPFAFLTLQGKTVLYATKDCTEQLRKIHGVSTQIVSKENKDGMLMVHIRAKDKTGREDEDVSVIPVGNLKDADMANAIMKAITKAKRRVTLSICGLGILDESELDTIKDIKPSINPQITENHPLKKHVATQVLDEIEVVENQIGDFVCKVGKKYNGMTLKDIGSVDLQHYLGWLENSAAERNQEISGDWLEFKNHAEAYLKSLVS